MLFNKSIELKIENTNPTVPISDESRVLCHSIIMFSSNGIFDGKQMCSMCISILTPIGEQTNTLEMKVASDFVERDLSK